MCVCLICVLCVSDLCLCVSVLCLMCVFVCFFCVYVSLCACMCLFVSISPLTVPADLCSNSTVLANPITEDTRACTARGNSLSNKHGQVKYSTAQYNSRTLQAEFQCGRASDTTGSVSFFFFIYYFIFSPLYYGATTPFFFLFYSCRVSFLPVLMLLKDLPHALSILLFIVLIVIVALFFV